jgi:hypothetical protein
MDVGIVVAAHTVKDDNILLLALKGIDSVNLESSLLVKLLRNSLTFLFKFLKLACIRGNDCKTPFESRHILSDQL